MPDRSEPKVVPSILAADFAHLEQEVASVEAAGVELIHVDVMDGHYVPNLTFGPMVVEALDRLTDIPLDVHLMVELPEQYFEPMVKAGADLLTIHAEVTPLLSRAIDQIKGLGIKAGLALNPGTPLVLAEEVLGRLDLLLVMSVEPGFAGQKFVEGSTAKLQRAREMIDSLRSEALLEVDGGINRETIGEAVRAGADILVAASAIFGDGRIEENVTALRERVRQALQ